MARTSNRQLQLGSKFNFQTQRLVSLPFETLSLHFDSFSKRLVKLFWLSMTARKAAKGKNQATAQPQLGSELGFRT
jgi:hypothetical protein